MLPLLCFACAAALVEASFTGSCGIWFFDFYCRENDYRYNINSAVSFSHGETTYVGNFIAPRHALIKKPDENFNIHTADARAGFKHLKPVGPKSGRAVTVQESTSCGNYTVVTFNKEVVESYHTPCAVSNEEGTPLDWALLYGFHPETSYLEVSRFTLKNNAMDGMADKEVAQLVGGSLVFVGLAKENNKTTAYDPIRMEMPAFFYNDPDQGKPGIYGHFDQWVGGEGQLMFTFTRFNNEDIECFRNVVEKKEP